MAHSTGGRPVQPQALLHNECLAHQALPAVQEKHIDIFVFLAKNLEVATELLRGIFAA